MIPSNGCALLRDYQLARLERHREFVSSWEASHGPLKYRNRWYGFPVMTAQEEDLRLALPLAVASSAPRELEMRYETPSLNSVDGAAAAPSVSDTPPGAGKVKGGIFARLEKTNSF